MTDGTCLVAGVCEVTLETSDRHFHFALSVPPGGLDDACVRLRELDVEFQGPVEHSGGDRSLYCEDPAGNVLELWDFFHRGEGSDGVDALASFGG